MEIILKILWLILPAGVANMSPVLFKWINFLNKPVDFGFKTKDEKFLFGKNKTYRGFFFGTLLGILIFYIQVRLYSFAQEYTFFDYTKVNWFLIGFLLSFGALLGDLIESFFKRRVGIESGKEWIPFDQIDWILGALFLLSFQIWLGWKIFFLTILIWGILHPIVNLIGYWLKIKKNKF